MLSSQYSRRELLKKAGRYSAASLLGLNYGCSIASYLEDKPGQSAIIYGTKYGSTQDTALWIRKGMGNKCDLFNVEDIVFSKITEKYDTLILGSGIWIDGIHERLREFLMTQKNSLTGKVAATFIVCGTDGNTENGRKRIETYFADFHGSLTKRPIFSEYFGGRIIVEKLTTEDREILIDFYRRYLNSELTDWDRTEPEKAARFGEIVQNREYTAISRVVDKLISNRV